MTSGAALQVMARMAQPTAAGKQQGVAYLVLLIALAAMGAALAATGTIWHEVQQRDKERELLFVGKQWSRAIKQYFENSPGGKTYPPTIESLLLDPRMPGTKRYLRRPYRDPLTNSDHWGLVTAPQGGIMGVYSLAGGAPIKQANFSSELAEFAGASSYAAWKFVYPPATNQPAK